MSSREKMLKWIESKEAQIISMGSGIYTAAGYERSQTRLDTLKEFKSKLLLLDPPVDEKAVQKVIEDVLNEFAKSRVSTEALNLMIFPKEFNELAKQITAALKEKGLT